MGRWLVWQEVRIAQLDGSVKQLGQNGFADLMFPTVQAGQELLDTADTYYQVSLQDWPTLAGQIYRQTNRAWISSLMGLGTSPAGRRSGRTQGLTDFDRGSDASRSEKTD